MSFIKLSTIIPFLMSISIAGFCQSHSPIKSGLVKGIKIEYVNTNIETPVNVNCWSFENYFRDQIKIEKIIKKREIAKTINYINKFLESAKGYADPPDVRMKILIQMSNGLEQTFCMGRLTSSFNGINYINDKRIVSNILNTLRE